MSDKAKAKALAYIEQCEQGPRRHAIGDFEEKVLKFIEARAADRVGERFCSHTFVEYVLLEVRGKNRMKSLPLGQQHMRIVGYIGLLLARQECKERWGASPRFHGKIHRKLINDAVADVGMLHTSIPLYFPY